MTTLLKNGMWGPGTTGRVLTPNPLLLSGAAGLDCPEDIVDFVQKRLDFYPDEKQIQVLRGGARGIVNCTRQWGKSTVTAAKAVHRAYTTPNSLILAVTPCGRQSGEFVRKAEEFVRRLGMTVRRDGDNGISIAFQNGSRIVGLPGNEATTRGFSNVSLLLFDEASRVPDELFRAMRPTLAVGGGDLWLMSTPCGKRGFFWTNGRAEERFGSGSACRLRSARGSGPRSWNKSGRRGTMPGFGRSICVSLGRSRGGCFRRSRLTRLFGISSR